MDQRIEDLIGRLSAAPLDDVPWWAREKTIERHLNSFVRDVIVPLHRATGGDGSVRTPDAAVIVPGHGAQPLSLAIEYKLYRRRSSGAGELDRGLGQCLAYAEKYDAVLLYIVFMAAPRDRLPAHWFDRSRPLRVKRDGADVPVYVAARPRSWTEAWAQQLAAPVERT